MILVVLDCIKFKLFVMLLCHNEILLQHVYIVPCLYIFGTSHFDLYYLYSSTNILEKVPKIKDFYIARLCSNTQVSMWLDTC